VVFAVLYVLEGLFPLVPAAAGRGHHDARNLGIGLLNTLPLLAGLGALTALVALATERHGWGLLGAVHAPAWVETVGGLLLLDLWMYAWHVANHKVPLLWRFHRMHHSDNRLDASSAVRFHLGEVLLSFLLRLGVIALLGLTVRQVLLYELILLPVILLHHANLALPRPLEAVARWLLVTPDIHHVHHSRVPRETDSNYGSVLPWWDRLFRTFRMQSPENLRYGLKGWDEETRQSLRGLLLTPFLPRERRDD
jgi:sterol desaturase/sphingolipid hydroxylase (fatty acid hydroxylase superfamily)